MDSSDGHSDDHQNRRTDRFSSRFGRYQRHMNNNYGYNGYNEYSAHNEHNHYHNNGQEYANNHMGSGQWSQWFQSPASQPTLRSNYVPPNEPQYHSYYRQPQYSGHRYQKRSAQKYGQNDKNPNASQRQTSDGNASHANENSVSAVDIAANASSNQINATNDRLYKSNAEHYHKNNNADKDKQKKYGKVNGNKQNLSSKNESKALKVYENDENQREIMDEQLRKGDYECMVCCEEVRIRDSVWNCDHCYNIFHLKCIKTWANSSIAPDSNQAVGNSWRCPACQSEYSRIPYRYHCFCGKARDPELNRYLVPHSCGDMCGRKRKDNRQMSHQCPHKCTLLCHPGPCPPCQTKVTRMCACGKSKITVSCETNDDDAICDNICSKALNCGQHRCERVCHSGKCDDCDRVKDQLCFCGKDKRNVKCDSETSAQEMYSCNEKCGKKLNCGYHICEKTCHSGECDSCALDPKLTTHCSCGKTELIKLGGNRRRKCTDPIPVCRQVCDKELNCGPKTQRHTCKMKCHFGPCRPCDQKTVIKCRCGANSENVDCIVLSQQLSSDGTDYNFDCKKRCNKKKKCGRHKCLNQCCVDEVHDCDQICGKKLACERHTCQELCHFNNCPQCWNISWDELTCRCGSAIKLPPIHCGTKRPECGGLCSRAHPCTHAVTHLCHDDDCCPPCTHLVAKLCYGSHELRPAIPCYQEGVSCGFSCLKPLSCGLHKCQKICHPGECGECTLPCPKINANCGHVCGLRCHQSTVEECPKSNCKVMVKVTCGCGIKTDQMYCYKVNDESSWRLPANVLANARIQRGESVDIADIVRSTKDYRFYQLKCDDKCAIIERNRKLAEALDINGADFSPDPDPPKYSDMLKDAARDDPSFVADIYEKLCKLVLESKQSKMNFKNLNFPPMNSNHRHIIHELAEFFGCKTHAIDREPNRSVVVKAAKDRCYLPTASLMDIVKNNKEIKKSNSNKIILKICSFDQENVKSEETVEKIAKNNEKSIDYFDFTGD